MAFSMILAIICIYMILASQFESLIHPFTIMVSLPFALIGAFGGLLIANMHMSIFAMIGLITYAKVTVPGIETGPPQPTDLWSIAYGIRVCDTYLPHIEGTSDELEKSLNGGLALLRAQAEQKGERDVAVLLDQARVERAEGGGLMFDVAVPGDFLLKSLGCGPDGAPLPGAQGGVTGHLR